MTKPLIISPTGQGIRADSRGSGYYHASRGSRLHQGADFICTPGQDVYCPIAAATVVRLAFPYKDRSYGGLLLRNEHLEIKLFYFEPADNIVGKTVSQGAFIGTAQNIALRYRDPEKEDMTPHVHLGIHSADPLLFINGQWPNNP